MGPEDLKHHFEDTHDIEKPHNNGAVMRGKRKRDEIENPLLTKPYSYKSFNVPSTNRQDYPDLAVGGSPSSDDLWFGNGLDEDYAGFGLDPADNFGKSPYSQVTDGGIESETFFDPCLF